MCKCSVNDEKFEMLHIKRSTPFLYVVTHDHSLPILFELDIFILQMIKNKMLVSCKCVVICRYIRRNLQCIHFTTFGLNQEKKKNVELFLNFQQSNANNVL